MQTDNIHVAKTQLPRLIEQAVKGDSFIIAKVGRPLVKVTRQDKSEGWVLWPVRSPFLMISTAWATGSPDRLPAGARRYWKTR